MSNEINSEEVKDVATPWIVFQIGSESRLDYRFVIAPEGFDPPLEVNEYLDTTSDAEGVLGGAVTIVDPRREAAVKQLVEALKKALTCASLNSDVRALIVANLTAYEEVTKQ
jgi:hypothetical protein